MYAEAPNLETPWLTIPFYEMFQVIFDFQQARSHLKAVERKKVVLPIMEWPAQSPNLNLIKPPWGSRGLRNQDFRLSLGIPALLSKTVCSH